MKKFTYLQIREMLHLHDMWFNNVKGGILADLTGADLAGVDLAGANLTYIKEDFFNKLLLAKNEVLGLYNYLMTGRINGSVYVGECACFIGTISKVAKEHYESLSSGLKPDPQSPIERWFLGIRKDDIPQNSQISAITATWMREFMDNEKIIYP